MVLEHKSLAREAAITMSKAVRRHRVFVGIVAALLILGAIGFWWHPAWAISVLLILAAWIGSGAMPGIR